MDPDETLKRLRECLGGDHSGYTENLNRNEIDEVHAKLCEAEELWQALDSWMKKVGYVPDSWCKA